MRHLVLVLLGLIVAAGLGYFVGYDHGFGNIDTERVGNSGWDTGNAAQAMADIIGMWQSTGDPKFTREILNDGSVVDRYQGKPDSRGHWMVFTKDVPDAAFVGTLEEGVTYLSISISETEKLYFKILKTESDSLELGYIDRGLPAGQAGNTLSFKRIK